MVSASNKPGQGAALPASGRSGFRFPVTWRYARWRPGVPGRSSETFALRGTAGSSLAGRSWSRAAGLFASGDCGGLRAAGGEAGAKGLFTAGFLARLAYEKHVLGRPVHRIVQALAADGLRRGAGRLMRSAEAGRAADRAVGGGDRRARPDRRARACR